MAATSHPEFNEKTEGLEVAKAFSTIVKGKTVIVTGVNRAGIGFSIAESFASQSPSHMIIAGRNRSKIDECIAALKSQYADVDYRPLVINLSSQQSVRAAAAEVLSWSDVPAVDFLINSAGVMLLPERTLSEDKIEMHFATNHIGHFLFTCLITPKLIHAARDSPKGATRVVNVSSGSPMMGGMRWSDTNFEKKNKDLPQAEQPNYELLKMWGTKDAENQSYIPLEGYNQSKVANVLFGIGVTQKLYAKYGILGLAVHPGVISTELGRNAASTTMDAVQDMMKAGVFTYRTLGAGASTPMVAALDPKLGAGETRNGRENHGAFLIDCQICDKANPLAVSSDEAEKLWTMSEELVEEKFSW